MSLSRKHPKKKLKEDVHDGNDNEPLPHPTVTVHGVEPTESSVEHESTLFRRPLVAGYPTAGDSISSSQFGFRSSYEQHAESHPQFLQPGRTMVWNYPYGTENPYYIYPHSQHAHGGYFHEESTQSHAFGPPFPFHIHPNHAMPPMSPSGLLYYNPPNPTEDGQTGLEAYHSADSYRYVPDPDNYTSDKDIKQMASAPLLTTDKSQRSAALTSRGSNSNFAPKTFLSNETRMTTTSGGKNNDKTTASSSSLVAANSFRRRNNSRSSNIVRVRVQRYREERARVRQFRILGMTLLAERLLSPDRFQELKHAIRAQEEERTGGGGGDEDTIERNDAGLLDEAKDSENVGTNLHAPGFKGE
jgi:hypothetical protein